MADQAQKTYPAIKGLLWYREQHYSFFVPNDWHRLYWSDGRDGVIFGPDPTDPFTVFGVDIQNIGTTITPEDFECLTEGFFEGIEQLPDSVIESRDRKIVGKLYELEAKYTFNDDGDTRKRWVRLFYYKTYQIAMSAQGATTEKYDYWLPIFFEAMMTARIHSKKPQNEFIT